MGVVRQEVNRSPGSLGFMGRTSLGPQAPINIEPSSRPMYIDVADKLVEFWRNMRKEHQCNGLAIV